jgi:hypothetical protein
MATPPDISSLRALMSATPAPEWETPADLARMSIEGLWRGGGIREQRSAGVVRLTGPAVSGSSARIDSVGEIMIVLQRLVSASGASLRGFKSLAGRLTGDIKSLTQLNLRASPLMGSIILTVEPREFPAHELTNAGQAMLIDQETHQLVDLSVDEVFALLTLGKDIGPDVDESAFLAKVVDMGPRVASALRDFAKDVRSDEFDFEFRWEEPGEPTRRVTITPADAQRISDVVVSRELDRDVVTLDGTLRTVSDVCPLVLELADGELQTVKTTGLDHSVIVKLRVGDQAKFKAEMRVEATAGGELKVSYTAISHMTPIEPSVRVWTEDFDAPTPA